MKLAVLRNYIAIARCGSFTKAAEQLLISQPTLSRQISELEEELGVQLFVRNKDGLSLSPAGEILIEEARSIIEQCDRIPSLFLSGSPDQTIPKYYESLRIGLPADFKTEEIYRTVEQLRQEYPEADIQVSQENISELVHGINSNRFDAVFGLTVYFKDLPDAERVLYRHNRLLAAISLDHPLARMEKTNIRELKRLPFILIKRDLSPILFDRLIAQCVQYDFSPHAAAYVNSMHEGLRMASNGLGVAFIFSQMHMEEYAERYNLRFLEIEENNLNEPISVIYKKKNPKMILQVLLDHLEYEQPEDQNVSIYM